MKFDSLSAAQIYGSFLAGAGKLNSQKEYINELNVFPVPDGDTGTNMSMTMMSAVSALYEVSDTDSLEQVCKAVANGSLRGARGNSGVILSQLLRGFTKTLADSGKLDAGTAAMAFNKVDLPVERPPIIVFKLGFNGISLCQKPDSSNIT